MVYLLSLVVVCSSCFFMISTYFMPDLPGVDGCCSHHCAGAQEVDDLTSFYIFTNFELRTQEPPCACSLLDASPLIMTICLCT